MESDIAPLPIRVPPVDAESGLGFLLRAFGANGETLARARQRFGIHDWRSLTPRNVTALAWATQVEPGWLSERLMLRSAQAPEHFLFCNQAFRSQAADSNMGAKVCADCVRENRWCRRVWLLRGAIACPVHRRLLIDTCGRCQRRISWRRTGVDVCTCGRYLAEGLHRTDASPLDHAESWMRWLDARLDQPATSSHTEHVGIPRLLNCLSIDGATALVVAFGMIDGSDIGIQPARQQITPIGGLCAVIHRGIERLGAIDGAPQEVRRYSACVHLSALERLKRTGVATPDRDCAALLLCYLGKRSHPSRGGRHRLGQLELFT